MQKLDAIILSQSCDLEHSKIENVLVCPYYSLTYWLEHLPIDQKEKKSKQKAVNNLRKGHLPAYHLLNKESDWNTLDDYQVVDFRNVYGVNFNLLETLLQESDNRIRLLPPYREHLSQAFARYFMRVGLPQDIVIESNY